MKKTFYFTRGPLLSVFSTKGLTLLELMVVIVILGSVLLIVFPRIPYLEGFVLRSEARRVAGFLRYIEDSASTKKIYYRVWFYPETESMQVETSTDGIEFEKDPGASLKGFTLKGGTDMQDVVLAGLGKVAEGEVGVVFNPTVGAEPFNLHLKHKKRSLTLRYNPYSGRVKILEGYV